MSDKGPNLQTANVREQLILRLVKEGKSNGAIIRALKLKPTQQISRSWNTVKPDDDHLT